MMSEMRTVRAVGGTQAHAAPRPGMQPANGTWWHLLTSTPPRGATPALRRVVATATGEFDMPCAVCGIRPTTVLIEWETGASVTGLGPPDQQVEFHASFEWRYYCAQHAAVIPSFPSSGGVG
jgi:hypothetical protein